MKEIEYNKIGLGAFFPFFLLKDFLSLILVLKITMAQVYFSGPKFILPNFGNFFRRHLASSVKNCDFY